MRPSVAISLPLAGAWIMLIAHCCDRSSRLTLTLVPWYNSMGYYVILKKTLCWVYFCFKQERVGFNNADRASLWE